MMTKSKELHGVLFKNNKGDNPNRPDRRGTCTIDGVAYDIAGWVKKDKKNESFLSLSFSKAKEQSAQKQTEGENLPF